MKYYFLIFIIFIFISCTSEDSSNLNNATTNNTSNNIIENEPYYKYLWHIDSHNSYLNQKGYQIAEDADINIIQAWEITKGEDIKVAIIDDSFDINHEDLKENILLIYNADKDSTDVKSYYGTSHGNTCAGFIVAPINGKGIIGTAPKSKLIAIKLESQFDSDTIKAFEYAKNNGAKVISCSWGSENISEALNSELQSLYEANITVLFASGNDGKSLDNSNIYDESESPWVIGVGSSGENNDVTSYSNYGSNIDIIAPGGNTEESIGLLGIDDSGEKGSTNQNNFVTNDYAFTDGTSFATPVTAGIVALMYSVNNNLTPKQIKDILISTADKIGIDANYIEGFDEKRAFGKINALKAVNEAIKLKN